MTDKPKKPAKTHLLLIFLTVFIDLIGFGIIIPILPTCAERFHADAVGVGMLMMSYSLMQFFFTPFWGRLSDKVGRRPILLGSLAASAVGYLIWGFADSLWMLFASRMIAGAGNANLSVAQAYIADVTKPEDRAKGMGLIGAAFGLGFVLGPTIGGLAGSLGLSAIGFIAASFSLLDLVLTFFLLPEPEQRSQAAHERFKLDPGFYLRTLTDKSLRLPLLLFFVFTFAFANMETTLVLLTERRFSFAQNDNSWMFAYIGLVMVLVQGGFIGRLSKRFGESSLVAAGTALVALGLLTTAWAANVPMLYGALALLAVGAGINTPSNQSILSRVANPADVGGVMGVGQSLSTLGRILGPLAGGVLFQYVGQTAPYYVGASCMLAAFALSFGLPKLPPAKAERVVPAPPDGAEAPAGNGKDCSKVMIDLQQFQPQNVSTNQS